MFNLLYRKVISKILLYVYKGNTKKEIDIIVKYDPLNILQNNLVSQALQLRCRAFFLSIPYLTIPQLKKDSHEPLKYLNIDF